MARLLPHVLPRRFWTCSCCSALHTTTPNTFHSGDANEAKHKCMMCSASEHQCDDPQWVEIDEAFFLLEINASDEGFREAKEMVDGTLAWRSNYQHRRQVPDYALPLARSAPKNGGV